jgi:hypothetical protein
MRKRTLGNMARMATLGILVTLSGWTWGLLDQSAMGQATCQVPLPAPCMADGVCRPKRTSWGWSQTRWRPWPGDDALMQPSLSGTAGAQTPTKEEVERFLRPPAEEEDLRTRKKEDSGQTEDPADSAPPVPNSEVPSNETPAGVLPSEETEGRSAPSPLPIVQAAPVIHPANHGPDASQNVAIRLPAALDISYPPRVEAVSGTVQGPVLVPQLGSAQPLPSGGQNVLQPLTQPPFQSQTPVQTPLGMVNPVKAATSARKQITNGQTQAGQTLEDAPPALPAALKRTAAQRRGTPPAAYRPVASQVSATNGTIQDQRVQPAGWSGQSGIRLINPAAALAEGHENRPLRQAIYYEATAPNDKRKN